MDRREGCMLVHGTDEIDVQVGISPGSDRNPVNEKSNSRMKGTSASAGDVLPVVILTTDDYDFC